MSTTSRLDVVLVEGERISAITNSSTVGGIEKITSMGSSDVSPLFCGHGTQTPEIPFTTNDLIAVFDTIGVTIFGAALTEAAYQYWKLAPQAGRTARSALSHHSCAVNAGVVFWERVNLVNNGMSTVDMKIVTSYDGTNAPIVVTGSVALPTTELAAVPFFGTGPIQINGTLIEQIQDVTIESGVRVEPKFSDSVPWPYRVNLVSVEPTVRITTETISNLSSIGLVGGALNGTTGLACYARKYVNNAASGAQRVAAATAEHLKFTALNGTYHVSQMSASGNDAGQLEIMCYPTAVNSGATPLTIATSAIPTS